MVADNSMSEFGKIAHPRGVAHLILLPERFTHGNTLVPAMPGKILLRGMPGRIRLRGMPGKHHIPAGRDSRYRRRHRNTGDFGQ